MTTSISVVVPCFNARPWLRATLRSALQQDVPRLELIVVDDGSTDGGAELVQAEFPMARIARTRRQGPSRARNVGTHLATGDFIQYLDADDQLAEGKLRRQIEALDSDGADVAYGDWQEMYDAPTGDDELGQLIERQIEGPVDIALFTDFWCPPAVYLFRRRIVERVGGWNEALPVIQDARFALDCALQDGKFVYCAGVQAYYRVHTQGSVSTRDRPAFIRDRLRNARAMEMWWTTRGQLDRRHREAVLKVYGQVARDSFTRDDALFDQACTALEQLQPGYRPSHPWHLALASRLFGYRRAESVALRYRNLKHLVRHT
jgi:glycosyltransferase involved in cell wall biosynthesis